MHSRGRLYARASLWLSGCSNLFFMTNDKEGQEYGVHVPGSLVLRCHALREFPWDARSCACYFDFALCPGRRRCPEVLWSSRRMLAPSWSEIPPEIVSTLGAATPYIEASHLHFFVLFYGLSMCFLVVLAHPCTFSVIHSFYRLLFLYPLVPFYFIFFIFKYIAVSIVFLFVLFEFFSSFTCRHTLSMSVFF